MKSRTRPASQVPAELLKLRSATTVFLAMLNDAEEWAQQAAKANRSVRPDYAAELDGLRDQLTTAMLPDEMGTPAGIARVLTELLGEA